MSHLMTCGDAAILHVILLAMPTLAGVNCGGIYLTVTIEDSVKKWHTHHRPLDVVVEWVPSDTHHHLVDVSSVNVCPAVVHTQCEVFW